MSPAAEESAAGLGHRLRTPLTHIIGYSALLLEAEGQDQIFAARLAEVNTQAEVILARIEHWLSPCGPALTSAEKMGGLRAEMAEPLTSIIRTVGAVVQSADETILLDVLRIGRACTELLSFVQQEPGAAPRVSMSAAPVPASQSGAEPARAPVFAGRVLIVDDNPANRDMIDRQLTRYGYEPVRAESGATGLQILQQGKVDLVLLDVMMPGLNGVEVLQRMKAQPALAPIPVIMISALDEVESAAQCIELGAEDYLVKPFDPVLLRARLHSALERRRLEEEQRQRTRELEVATENLRRANDDLESFASVASHDLQEPLRTITTTLQLFALQSEDAMTEEQTDLLALAVDGARRMSRLISGLLAYSLSAGTEATLTEVNCEAALLEAITNLREAIRDSSAQISHEDLPVVMAHPRCMVQIFQNLVGNAIKYRSEAKPEIRIAAIREGSEWVLSVTDNGLGIEPQFLRRVFQPFGRLHGQDRPGTGLGLAICERMLRRSGGKIWVESEPGRGSTFYFTAHSPGLEEVGH